MTQKELKDFTDEELLQEAKKIKSTKILMQLSLVC